MYGWKLEKKAFEWNWEKQNIKMNAINLHFSNSSEHNSVWFTIIIMFYHAYMM